MVTVLSQVCRAFASGAHVVHGSAGAAGARLRRSALLQPPEWAPHLACITAWPEQEYAWGAGLAAVQNEFISLLQALCGPGGEPVWMLCAADSDARARLSHLQPQLSFLTVPYGDVWLRDTGPILVGSGRNARRLEFNGWGGKYLYPHDAEVAALLSERLGLDCVAVPLVGEGGALDSDGAGTYLSTRACLLNPNRNPGLSEADVEGRLAIYLGAERVVWLDEGLRFDHTDGHVDNVARFVAPGHVLCMACQDPNDPQADRLRAIEATLRASVDASGRPLTVHTVPSPGLVLGPEGEPMPASYLNFYIANHAVIVPGFSGAADRAAAAALAPWFPGREVVMRPARALLAGGGTFHCVTQQVPAPVESAVWTQ